MREIEQILADLGVPDSYGIVRGIRARVAQMLVDACRKVGRTKFVEVAAKLTGAVVRAAAEVPDA